MYTLHTISNGDAGTKQTLAFMSKVVRQYKTNKTVRETALSIISDLPEKNFTNEARYIHSWVRDHIRYAKDVRGVETLQTPVKTLELMQGDCDDQTILFCALMESVGHKTRMLAVATHGRAEFSHVFPETNIGGRWVACECINKGYTIGQRPPEINRVYKRNN